MGGAALTGAGRRFGDEGGVLYLRERVALRYFPLLWEPRACR